MPAIRWLGRRWRTASDDYVFVSVTYFVLLGAWGAVIVSQVYSASTARDVDGGVPFNTAFVAVSAVVENSRATPRLERHFIRRCPQASPSLANTYLGMGCVDLIAAVLFLVTAILSAQGGIFEESKRRLVPTMLMCNILSLLAAFVLCCVCAALVVHLGSGSLCFNARRAAYLIYASLAINIILSTAYFAMTMLLYDPLGGHDIISLEDYAQTWQQRCRWLCCQFCRRTGLEEEAYEDVSWVLASTFRGYDMVPSDIVAGLLLLHGYQQCSRRVISSQVRYVEESCTEGGTRFYDKVSTQAVPSPRLTAQQRAMIAEFERYCRFYMASYGWMLYEYNRCCAVPELVCCVDPFVCCRDYPCEVYRDGHSLDLGVLLQITGIPKDDLIFANWKNRLFQPVFYVAYDRTTDAIVISIRGTMSFVDCLTDLVATPCTLNIHDSDAVEIDTHGTSLGGTTIHGSLHSFQAPVPYSDEDNEICCTSDINHGNSSDNNSRNNNIKSNDKGRHDQIQIDPYLAFRNMTCNSVHGNSSIGHNNKDSLSYGGSEHPAQRERWLSATNAESVRSSTARSHLTCDHPSAARGNANNIFSQDSVLPPSRVPSTRATASEARSYNTRSVGEECAAAATASGVPPRMRHSFDAAAAAAAAAASTSSKSPYQVHNGMHRCAQFVLRQLEETGILQNILQGKYASKKIILIGHSLGAGVAIILGIILRFNAPKLLSRMRVLAYAPPGAILSKALVDYCSSFTMGCYCGYDMIPRLSQHTFDAFRELLFDVMAASSVPKARIFLNLFRTADLMRAIHSSHRVLREESVRSDCENATSTTGMCGAIGIGSVESRSYRQMLLRSPCIPPMETTRLYPCQTLIHFCKVVTRHHYNDCPIPCVRKREPIYVPVFETPQDVQVLISSPSMFSDHFPDKLFSILTATHGRLQRGELNRYFVESTPCSDNNSNNNNDAPLSYIPL